MAENIARAAGAVSSSVSPAEEASPGEKLRAGRDQAIEEARSMIRDAADTQRRKAADTLGGVAEALHRTAKDFDRENQTMARYTDMAAERLDQFSRYLRQAHWNDLVDGVEDFARRQPWLFIGGAMAAGFVVARALKSSGAAEETGQKVSEMAQSAASNISDVAQSASSNIESAMPSVAEESLSKTSPGDVP